MEGPPNRLELLAQQLRRLTDPASLGFETTRDLPAPQGMVGQDRAQEAIDFALEIQDSRYNLFVAGPPGSGRLTAVMTAVEHIARARPTPKDWCYVYHFEQPEEPRAVALPPAKGREFARDVDAFVASARREMRRTLTADSATKKRAELVKDLQEERSAILADAKHDAKPLGFLLEFGPNGVAIQPFRLLRPDADERPPAQEEQEEALPGKSDAETEIVQPINTEEFQRLAQQEREAIEAKQRLVEEMLDKAVPRLRALDEEEHLRVRALDREIVDAAVRPLTEDLVSRYVASADAIDFIRSLSKDMIAHVETLRAGEDVSGADQASASNSSGADETSEELSDEWLGDPGGSSALTTLLHRYRVKVIIAHREDEHAPVVHEINPTRNNLVGWQEFGTHEGRPFTDHMMIKPGALHRANGGFLVLQANDILRAPNAWDALKRALRFETISLDGGAESQAMPVGASQRPEPIPASLRVVLIGDRGVYFGLSEADPEFRQLFKVRADFDVEMPRSAEVERAYARYAGHIARTTGGAPLTAEAVAALSEEGSRWVEHQERLATMFGELRELTVEACYWAKRTNATTTTAEHVRQAIQARERRLSLIADKEEMAIQEGQTLIQTTGAAIGQVNALTVVQTSDFSFSKPTRITARTAPGQAGVIDIEHEVALSGSLHSKGVYILSGYLRGRFAQEFPLSLSASLTFEQSYGGVDGDSASSSELYALLSSLAGVPIRQSLAVTGSINQPGEIQPVGSVSEKIEGFFHVCQKRGLTGEHGVIIPRASIHTLMLRDEVIDAVRAGQFHIYAIATVDEGIELLTGIPAGQPDKDGRFLEGTINARVLRTLRVYSERVRDYFGPGGGNPLP
jgi:predicted ATP-dependent protease